MSKHTPGPWEADAVTSEHLHDVVLGYQRPGWGNPVLVATTFGDADRVGITNFEAAANARLIAAAPELLAACEAALAYIPCSEVHNWPPGFKLKDNALKLLRSVLAKAKGETHVK